MYRTVCVSTLVALCAGLAHSFSWDIVRGVDHLLEFIDINGTISHTEKITADIIQFTTYDPVHNRMLFDDYRNIFSFDMTTKKTEYLIRNTTNRVSSLTYDPATELVVWVEDCLKMYTVTLKPEFNKNNVNEKNLILLEQLLTNSIFQIAVDSCGGFIYFMTPFKIKKVRFNGSEKEVILHNDDYIYAFTLDQQAQLMYFTDSKSCIKSADFNGNNIKTILELTQFGYYLTVSKDFMYWLTFNVEQLTHTTHQIPKNVTIGIDVEPKRFIVRYEPLAKKMAAYYNINDIIPQEIQNCDNLKSLLPNNSVSTDVSLLCVHGTKVDGESRCECTQGYSGERCEVSVCHNYCLYGDCSTSAEGQPKCSCNAGYSGNRCEVNSCLGYCLNDGLCSLSEEGKPLCRCTAHYEGERCDVSLFQTKCFQAISLLKDMLNTADVTSVKGVTSTCASTDF